MPNYVYNNTSLPFPKTDLVPLQGGADETKYIVGADWNTLCQAVEDQKGVLRGAIWYGLTAQASDPAPAGISTYLWLKNDGTLHYKSGTDKTLSTGGSSPVVSGAGTGSAILNNGTGNATTGTNSTVFGENNQISGIDSFVEGSQNVETVTASATGGANNHLEGFRNTITVNVIDSGGLNHVEGNNNTLTGTGNACDFNHVEGNNNVITATLSPVEFNHVEGDGNHVSAGTAGGCYDSHVEGIGNICTDIDGDHVEGYHNTVSPKGGSQNHVEGNQNTLSGTGSVSFAHLEGNLCTATANTVHVQGDSASGSRETQSAKASGKFSAAGDAQASLLVLRGSTPGSGAGESVELKFGSSRNQTLQLEDGKGYTITVTAIAKDTVAGAKGVRSFFYRYSVMRVAGVTTIEASDTTTTPPIGSAGTASWTLAASVGAAPDRFVLTFTTGGTTAAARCVAKVEFVELLNA